MLRSMTGFSTISKEVQTQDQSGAKAPILVSLEAKTVNSRYFEASVKLPPALSSLETKISSLAKQQLSRGRLFLSINISSRSVSLEKVIFSNSMAEQYALAIKSISEKLGLENRASASEILRLPGVITLEKTELDEHFESQVLKLSTELIKKLNESRTSEGQQLKSDIQHRANSCSQAIEKIEKRNKEVVQKLTHALSELEASAPEQPDDTHSDKVKEAAHRLDKADVSEEVVRFKSHLESLSQALNSENPEKGKRLDFLCQELFRETNTVCSKSQDLETVNAAVQAKVELEKIKEQAQNIV